MKRILSILLSFFDDILPVLLPGRKSGIISIILLISANITPLIGIIIFNWNPFILLFIYWFESAIIGLMNIIKMLISGAIKDKKFSPGEFSMALFLSAFFSVHYGIFMLVHGVFLTVFYVIFTDLPNMDSVLTDFNFTPLFSGLMPESMSVTGFLESEIFPIAALLAYHIIYFIMNFIMTGEFDRNRAEDYMMRPYPRIVIMQLTIILGAFALFLTGFRSMGFIIVWITAKIIGDLKITAKELKFSGSSPEGLK